MKTRNVEPIIEKTVDNKLELFTHMGKIHIDMEEITSDFVYAKLSEKNKEGVIETTNNAFYGIKLLKVVQDKATTWTYKNGKWQKTYLPKHKKEAIGTLALNIFKAYMTRVHMTIILNRNVKDNWFIRILAGLSEEDEQKEDAQQQQKTFMENLQAQIRPKEAKIK